MDVSYLREFSVLADCKSFTEAARQLHMTQSTLSKHIAVLERTFDCDLFVRTKQGVRMTKEGNVLLKHSVQILEDLQAARDEIKQVRGHYGETIRTDVSGPDAYLKYACRKVGAKKGLDPEEIGVLVLYLSGYSIDRIGSEQGISRDHVAQMLGETYKKLQVSSKEQALRLMYSNLE